MVESKEAVACKSKVEETNGVICNYMQVQSSSHSSDEFLQLMNGSSLSRKVRRFYKNATNIWGLVCLEAKNVFVLNSCTEPPNKV